MLESNSYGVRERAWPEGRIAGLKYVVTTLLAIVYWVIMYCVMSLEKMTSVYWVTVYCVMSCGQKKDENVRMEK